MITNDHVTRLIGGTNLELVISSRWQVGRARGSFARKANYRRSNAGRVTSAREIEIKWFDQVFSEPA